MTPLNIGIIKEDYKKTLIEKGIIDGSVRGVITVRLPRFKEFVENRGE